MDPADILIGLAIGLSWIIAFVVGHGIGEAKGHIKGYRESADFAKKVFRSESEATANARETESKAATNRAWRTMR